MQPKLPPGRDSIRRRGWPGVILWSILVLSSIVLMVIGLLRSTFFGFTAIPEFVEGIIGGMVERGYRPV
jgi:hypothetical protein